MAHLQQQGILGEQAMKRAVARTGGSEEHCLYSSRGWTHFPDVADMSDL